VRVLILGLNYLPESTSIGPYTAQLAEYLHGLGHRVQVITGFPMAPQWRVWDGYRGSWFRHEVINQVRILRTFLYVPKQPRKALKRVLFDTSFALSALLGGLTTGPCDVIVAISPPLQIGLTGWVLSRFKRAKLVVHLQDLVPDAAIATGALSESSRAVRFGRALERFVYQRASRIGVICDGFARNLTAKGVPARKLAELANFIDLDFMQPYPQNNSFRARYGIRREDFLVMYSGSVALKQGLEVFVDAAAELRAEPDIIFMLIGEGPYVGELQARADAQRLTNLRFLPLQSRERLPEQLGAADVLVVTQRQAVTDIVFPGKLLYYMAAGRPILAAVSQDSETGRFITEHQVGVVVPPEHPGKLAEAVARMKRDGPQELGRNGRRVAETMFDRRAVLPRFAELLITLAEHEPFAAQLSP
jgi:colanic acid biosynthesis glycosyl transferase WcaI